MAKYQTFDEYKKGEKIIRYLDFFERCWNFANESAVEKFTAANNARDEIACTYYRNCSAIHKHHCNSKPSCFKPAAALPVA